MSECCDAAPPKALLLTDFSLTRNLYTYLSSCIQLLESSDT